VRHQVPYPERAKAARAPHFQFVGIAVYSKDASESNITSEIATRLTSRTMVLGRLLSDRNFQLSGNPWARAHSRTVSTRFCCPQDRCLSLFPPRRRHKEGTYVGVNHRATLRIGRDRRHRRPEMPTAVEAGVPHVPLLRSLLRVTRARRYRQLLRQRAPVCTALHGNVTHPVVHHHHTEKE
jgi:hypothetical protein